MSDEVPVVETPAAPAPQSPLAAKIVIEGTKTERELQLEAELETERSARKKVEMDAATLLDENRRLKTPPPTLQPQPRHPREPLTFFDANDS